MDQGSIEAIVLSVANLILGGLTGMGVGRYRTTHHPPKTHATVPPPAESPSRAVELAALRKLTETVDRMSLLLERGMVVIEDLEAKQSALIDRVTVLAQNTRELSAQARPGRHDARRELPGPVRREIQEYVEDPPPVTRGRPPRGGNHTR